MISPPARAVLDELNAIVRLDGAEFEVTSAAGSVIELTLDLSGSDCPECVLPAELLVDLLTTRLAEADPDITEVKLYDPRQAGAHPTSDH